MSDYPKDFLELLEGVTAKRPRTVIQHILKYGYITSQELKDIYGYNHPPRAIRDVREHGIPLVTYRVTGSDGRKIAAYKFGSYEDIQNSLSKVSGRTVLSKALKQALIEKYGPRCFIYLEKMDESQLQVDHRIPLYEMLLGYPDNYDHIAGKNAKIVCIIFSNSEIDDYNKLIIQSGESTAQETIKKILHEYLK